MVASRVGGKRPDPPISRVATSTPHGISKRTMCRPTRRRIRGRLTRLGEKGEDDARSCPNWWCSSDGASRLRSALSIALGGQQFVVHGDLAHLGFQPGDFILAIVALA